MKDHFKINPLGCPVVHVTIPPPLTRRRPYVLASEWNSLGGVHFTQTHVRVRGLWAGLEHGNNNYWADFGARRLQRKQLSRHWLRVESGEPMWWRHKSRLTIKPVRIFSKCNLLEEGTQFWDLNNHKTTDCRHIIILTNFIKCFV